MGFIPIHDPHRPQQLADNGEALAYYLECAGANVIRDTDRFTIEFELADRARIAGELKRHNLTAKPISERQDRNRNGKICSIQRAEVRRTPEKTSYELERNLMAAICRRLDE